MRQTDEGGIIRPTGIFICERLYESVEPALLKEIFSPFPVEVFPQQCGTGCCSGPVFRNSTGRLFEKYGSFCILTCSCQENSFPGNDLDGRLIETKQGMSLLAPSGLFSGSGEGDSCPVLPSGSLDNEEYLSSARDYCMKDGKITSIVVPDTGSGAVDPEFVHKVEKITGLPVKISRTGLDFFENYLASRLYESAYRTMEKTVERSEAEKNELDRKYSDSLVAMDMLGLLVGLKDEENVIEATIELISTMFSPEQVVYVAVAEGIVTSVSKLKPGVGTESGLDILRGAELPEISEKISRNGFVLPVSVWGEIVGVLSVEGLDTPSDCEGYLSTIRLFLPLCGLAIRNARNYSALEVALKERDDEIELRKKAEEALSKAIKKLVLLSSITRHDILNQIMIANYHLEVAMEDYLELKDQLSPAIKAVDQIKRQIEFTRDYQEMGVSPPAWQSLAPLISECFSVRDYPAGVEVFVNLPPIQILGDPMLGKAFCNIISNAYIHAEGMTRLEISGEQSDNDFVIRIADNGSGVPTDKKVLIFKPGYGRIHGYGLFLVSEIFGITDITIRECGIEGEGAVFEIGIPPGSWRRAGD
ncbi:sensor histidine kinase [Methanolacinia paynteri]|uniref:sensor histidine kinase n=1 Tax=Methanolacinia paynteri TaxID=230356 RepID=UPI000693927E|nr:ATP-binding protein [Methanolacinia paynteri]